MDRNDLDAAIARLQEIAGRDRGRVSWRARQALADIERALTPTTREKKHELGTLQKQ